MSPIDSGNSVLLLDVSQHHHQSQHSHPQMHDGPCSSGCPCTIHAYAFGGDGTPTLDLCHRNPVGLDQPLGQSHHYNHHLHHHLHHHHHHQDYTSAWDDIPCESTAYSTLFQKGESPTTSGKKKPEAEKIQAYHLRNYIFIYLFVNDICMKYF